MSPGQGAARRDARSEIAYGALVACLCGLMGLSQVADYDLWWHIVYGNWALEHHELSHFDSFSHTAAGLVDIPYSWLFDVLVALAERGMGLAWLPLLQCGLTGLVFGTLFLAGRAWSTPPAFRAAGLIALAPVLRFHLVLRPHLLSFALLAGLLWCLSREWLRPWRFVAACVGLIWVWRQFHASFPLGVAVLGLFAAFPRFDRTGAPSGPVSWPVRWLAVALSGLALFLPPLGWEGTRFCLETARLASSRGGLVTEWRPPSTFPDGFEGFWVYGAVAVAVMLAERSVRTPLSVGLLAASGWMALGSARQICVFGLLTILPVTAGAGRLLGRLGRGRALGPLAVCAAAAWSLSGLGPDLYPPLGLGVARFAFPEGAVDFVREQALPGRLYNTHRIGGYLLARGLKVFWDGRLLLYRELFQRVDRALASPDAERSIPQLWDELGIGFAIVDYADGHPLTRSILQDPAWRLLYWDDAAMVLARGKGAAPWACVRPWDSTLGFLDWPCAGPELARKVREDPACSRAAALYGGFLLRRGDAQAAAVLLARFLKYQYESEWVRLGLGQAQILLGQPEQARRTLEPLLARKRSKGAAMELLHSIDPNKAGI